MKTKETEAPEVLWLGDHILLGATMWKPDPYTWKSCAIGLALRSVGREVNDYSGRILGTQTWPWLEQVTFQDVPAKWGETRETIDGAGLRYISRVFFNVCDGKLTIEELARTANKWQKKYDPTVKAAKKYASAHARGTKTAIKGGKAKMATNGTRNVLARITSK